MQAYDILIALRGRGDQINALKEKVELLRDAVTHITAGYGERAGGGSGEDKFAAHAARVAELGQSIEHLKDLRDAEADYCLRLIERMDGVKAKLIYNYYFKVWTLSAFANAEGYSDGYVRKLKSELDAELRGIEVKQGEIPKWYGGNNEE